MNFDKLIHKSCCYICGEKLKTNKKHLIIEKISYIGEKIFSKFFKDNYISNTDRIFYKCDGECGENFHSFYLENNYCTKKLFMNFEFNVNDKAFSIAFHSHHRNDNEYSIHISYEVPIIYNEKVLYITEESLILNNNSSFDELIMFIDIFKNKDVNKLKKLIMLR